jgi:endonuclease/exonuclease/phosphatase family metal-dependent hydrolase
MEVINNKCTYNLKCTKKDCILEHDTDNSKSPYYDKKCNYNLRCTRKDCWLNHDTETGKSPFYDKKCNFNLSCKRKNCWLQHDTEDGRCPNINRKCDYNLNCKRKNCWLEHDTLNGKSPYMDYNIEPKKTSTMPLTIKITTYNVLSDNLWDLMKVSENYKFKLDSESRWEKIKDKLINFMKEEHIIGLQEVTLERANKTLPKILEEYNYNIVYQSYGYEKNGFMGTGILIPKKYNILDIDNICVGEMINSIEKNILNIITLKEPITNHIFVVANYHMPCRYKEPEIMKNHCNGILKLLKKSYPTFFVGDLNFSPNDELHKLITINFDSIWNYIPIVPTIHSFVFEEYIGSLDHILFTKDLITLEKIIPIENMELLAPNDNCPSDHTSLTAIFNL